MNGTMEITTKIGCAMRCKYCPQALLMQEYKMLAHQTMMSLDTFKQCMDKIPAYITIDFSGMCEPWLNPQCTDMVEYAVATGHLIRIFTTLVGMTTDDIRRLSNLKIEQLVLHLPDEKRNAAIPIDDDYIERLKLMMQTVNAQNKGISCHGKLAPEVAPLVNQSWDIGSEMIDRAGNLELEDVRHQETPGEIFCDLCGFELNHNVLLPDGSVTLCCMDYGLKHILGNLLEQSYKEIVDGAVMRALQEQLHAGNLNILCHSCSNARSTRDLMKLYFVQKDETFNLWCEVNQQNHQLYDLREWCNQQSEAKKYLEDKCTEWSARVAELQQWNQQLESGKQYLEQQVSTKDARINELEQWTHQLEDAKAYLEQQSEAKDKRISELEQWCQEVTDGKAYVENQWNAEKENRREDAEKLEKLSQKLALLLGDEKIQKIIAKRKYQI